SNSSKGISSAASALSLIGSPAGSGKANEPKKCSDISIHCSPWRRRQQRIISGGKFFFFVAATTHSCTALSSARQRLDGERPLNKGRLSLHWLLKDSSQYEHPEAFFVWVCVCQALSEQRRRKVSKRCCVLA